MIWLGMAKRSHSLFLLLAVCMLLNFTTCFHRISVTRRFARDVRRRQSGELRMVFDFIRKRTEEGIAQVQNIATKTLEGKLGEALQESAEYVRMRNKIDAENLRKLTSGLSRSRERLLAGISGALDNNEDAIDVKLSKLEDVLLQADIGTATTSAILKDLSYIAKTEKLEPDDIMPILRSRLVEALTVPQELRGLNFAPPPPMGQKKIPSVIFVIGANGMGKTTTIGKIASRLKREANQTVLLGACDTFRAAAVEQLGEWARRANVSIEKPLDSELLGDPVPVVTRTLQRGIREDVDVIIIDTSGRLSNNFELIQQLQGMKAAIQKEIPSAPHETLLVVDGSVGRNAVDQAAAWRKYIGVSGLAITKLDGTARGGFVVSVVRDLELPVKFIGIGEKVDDLRDFEAEVFVDALLGNDAASSEKLKQRVAKMMLDNDTRDSSLRTESKSEMGVANRLRASFEANYEGESSNSNVKEKTKVRKRPQKQQQAKKKK